MSLKRDYSGKLLEKNDITKTILFTVSNNFILYSKFERSSRQCCMQTNCRLTECGKKCSKNLCMP